MTHFCLLFNQVTYSLITIYSYVTVITIMDFSKLKYDLQRTILFCQIHEVQPQPRIPFS